MIIQAVTPVFCLSNILHDKQMLKVSEMLGHDYYLQQISSAAGKSPQAKAMSFPRLANCYPSFVCR